jgi:hypothetical protein
MLVARWSILQLALSASMGVRRQVALVMACCWLHKYYIGQPTSGASPPSVIQADPSIRLNMMLRGAVGLTQDGRPQGDLDGGRHFDGVTSLSEVPHHLAAQESAAC